jgi:hypothetical protein
MLLLSPLQGSTKLATHISFVAVAVVAILTSLFHFIYFICSRCTLTIKLQCPSCFRQSRKVIPLVSTNATPRAFTISPHFPSVRLTHQRDCARGIPALAWLPIHFQISTPQPQVGVIQNNYYFHAMYTY